MIGESQIPQNQSLSESPSARRASEGDVQTGMSGPQEDGQREQVLQDLSHSTSQPFLSARPGISPTSSVMTRAYSNQEVSTAAPSETTWSEAESKPTPQILVPPSLLPQPAEVDRSSSDPSLLPLVYPTVNQTSPDVSVYPAPGAHPPGYVDSRPQSRTTAASITPPNIYDFLPHNLYASLHINPHDPRHSLSSNGSNGVHSPASPTLSSAIAGSMHQPYGVWVPPSDEQTGGLGSAAQYGYGMPSHYQRTGSRGGTDRQGSSFSTGGDGHPGNSGLHSGYQPTPDTNMAFVSMHQSMEPQHHAGMANGFPYRPMFQYTDGRHGGYFQPGSGWMNMPPNGYPYMNYPQYGQFGHQDSRGRGRGRGGRGRGRGTGFRPADYMPANFNGHNPNYSPSQGSNAWNGQPQWHSEGRPVHSPIHSGYPAHQTHTSAQAFGLNTTDGPASGQIALPSPAQKTADSGPEASLDGETAGRLLERKPYHPAPPANRSEWVMWVGNVPANATHEEMWKFFNSPLHWETSSQSSASASWLGVASIFLISRSNCAFVNLKNENDLKTAIAYFNGKTLRPWDPRCQPFLCRVRKADDDLKSGVGGQRGAGLHIKYIKDLRAKENGEAASAATLRQNTLVPTSSSQTLVESDLPISPAALEEAPEGEGRRRESVIKENNMISPAAFAAWQDQQLQLHGRSPSGELSFASTCSSFLVRNFPKRYFIMKSSTKEELDRSIKEGTWWTQPHNEPILDQAYRTSPEVYLIFGANKQGSFSGYAVMRSGIPAVARKHGSHSSQGHDASSSGSRSSKKSAPIANSRNAALLTPRGAAIQEEGDEYPIPPTRTNRLSSTDSASAAFAMSSPGEMTPGDELRSGSSDSPLSFRWNQTAPHPDYSRISMPGNLHGRAMTFDTKALARIRAEEALKQELSAKAKAKADEFELDEEAVRNAQRDHQEPEASSHGGVARKDMISSDESHAPAAQKASANPAITSSGIDGHFTEGNGHGNVDGTVDSDEQAQALHAFRVEWVRVGELPFSSIKHLRNPWNQDKEVKVSRDGTELEPALGSTLLAEWNRLGDSTLPGGQTSASRT